MKLDKYLLSNERAEKFRGQKALCIQRSQEFQVLVKEEVRNLLQVDIDEKSFKLQFEQDYSKREDIRSRVTERVGIELDEIKNSFTEGKISIQDVLFRYTEKTSREDWPSVLVEVKKDMSLEQYAKELEKLGYHDENLDKFRIFNVVQAQVPPELEYIKPLSEIESVEMVYDAEQEVNIPQPVKGEAEAELEDSVPTIFPPGEELPPDLPTKLGEGVNICIVDTGIDHTHPDFENRVVKWAEFTDDCNNLDEHGHGTHCAGIAAGSGISSGQRFKGVAPHATLLNAKVLDHAGWGTSETVLSGIRWAIENGADVISLSLGNGGTVDGRSILSRACDRAVELGVLVCVSAGNNGPEKGTITPPGDARNVITVGAVDKTKEFVSFSSRGPTDDPDYTGQKPNVMAPGMNIVSTKSQHCNRTPLSDNPFYTITSGTSMSCPHVSGACAVLLSYAKSLGFQNVQPQDIIDALYDGTDKLMNATPDDQGDGLINIPRSLNFLKYRLTGVDKKEEIVTEKKPTGLLIEDKSIILGRSEKQHRELGGFSLLDLGNIPEISEELQNYSVKIDGNFPHIIFLCGKRGSGKSHTLGVIAEELAKQSLGISTVIVDPIGIFWSMKEENDSKEEIELLKKLNLSPRKFKNVQVMAPIGIFEDYKKVVDCPLSIGIPELAVEDWCLLFGIDRFAPQGLLIELVLSKVRSGYTSERAGKKVKTTPTEKYSLGDIIECVKDDVELKSKEYGYAINTRRSMIARFRAASKWGIFSLEATPLEKIAVEDKVTVIDVSHPDIGESIRAMIVGILARKILSHRIKTTRMRTAETIPITWLLVDEAHLLVPSGRKTAASEALIQYAKLGRQPGCGLVLATQRPSATSDEILSQADMVIAHNMALQDDIDALLRRVPAALPRKMKKSDFVRGLPVGTTIIADQKTPHKAMLVQVRPRLSQHAGKEPTPRKKVQKPAEAGIDTELLLPEKPKQEIPIFSSPKAEPLKPTTPQWAGVFEPKISEEDAAESAKAFFRKLVFWKGVQEIESIRLRYLPLFQMKVKTLQKKWGKERIRVSTIFWDPVMAELILRFPGGVDRTDGLSYLFTLSEEQANILILISRTPEGISFSELGEELKLEKNSLKKNLGALVKEGLVLTKQDKDGVEYYLPFVKLSYSMKLPDVAYDYAVKKEDLRKIDIFEPQVKDNDMERVLKLVYPDSFIAEKGYIYYPYYEVVLKEKTQTRTKYIDAIYGKYDEEFPYGFER